jgi:hypothetical protein
VRALAWFALIVLPALGVAAEGTVKVDGVRDGRTRQGAALGAGATAR